MDIITHRAARWGPDDFDLPDQSSTQLPLEGVPQYLQPSHELQMRLPSSSSWVSIRPYDQFANPLVSSGYSGAGYEQTFVSSSSLPMPPPLRMPNPSGQLYADANSAYADLQGHQYLVPPVQRAFRNPWNSLNHLGNWTIDGVDFTTGDANLDGYFEIQQPSIFPSHHHHEATLPYSHHIESRAMPTLTQQTDSHSHTAPYQIPSPISHNPLPTAKSEEQPTDFRTPPTSNSQSLPSVSQPGDAAETREAQNAGMVGPDQSKGLPYVHSLCGKVFSTLTGVKKHHWGKKANDLATTTGCWAKHNKPDVAWDDHPSCKGGRSTPVVAKSASPTTKQRQTEHSMSQSSSLPAMDVPQFQPLPEFPTVDDLPRTVAKVVHTGNAPGSDTQEQGAMHQMPQVPSKSEFDSLLTAVNTVSQIEAPKPKGCTESIARNLDAQVAAAERYHSVGNFELSTSSFDVAAHRAIAPAALDVTGSSDIGEPLNNNNNNNNSGYYLHSTNEESSVLPPDIEKSYTSGALSGSFQSFLASSYGPARKRRKV